MNNTIAKYFNRYAMLLVLLCFTQIAISQNKSYTRYDVNNGLAGSTVYCMLQDKDGFIWFGTETGVSRFDGTHFKNFGTEDGMPDNEILKMFQDSKGRIWMAPFKKTICYYYRGKFHNANNDSLLRKIKPKSHILDIAEDVEGNILLQEDDELHLVSGQQVKLITTINGAPLHYCRSISSFKSGGFLVLFMDGLYQLNNGTFAAMTPINLLRFDYNYKFVSMNNHMIVARYKMDSATLTDLVNKRGIVLPVRMSADVFQLIGDTLFVENGQEGTVIHNLNDPQRSKIYLTDKRTSQTLIDNEGNYWFSTIGDGVYRLSSENVFSIKLHNKVGRELGAYCILLRPNKWIVGSDMMYVFQISHGIDSIFKTSILWDEFSESPIARTMALAVFDNDHYLIGTDMILEKVPASNMEINKSGISCAVKAIVQKSPGEFLVASNRNVISITVPNLAVKDTFWNERATTAFYYRDTVFVGTLDGLFRIANNKSRSFAGEFEPLLKSRINAMCDGGNNVMWIATDGAGLIGYRNGRVIQQISIKDGLSSNNCRALWASHNELWVGTEKGLNSISLDSNPPHIGKITAGDGLSSNVINAVAVQADTVIVATPEGVDFFDKRRLSILSRCNLVLDRIIVSNHELDVDAKSIRLAHRDNNIHFSFSGISFRSGGDMNYQYRLIGLDSNWKTTKENFLDYPTLPSGNYTLQLQAVNQFNVKSKLLTIPFTVEQLLSEKTWFRATLFLAILMGTGLFVFWLVVRVRKREIQKTEINSRMAELEQLALKSQMNPHFIFNCLNSIQQFVLDKDLAGSNRFITGFSRLIRQTLDISAKKEISLAEEIIYLSTYLELEKTRFEDKFSYEVAVADNMNANDYMIPPMMLQPFVENSIRHGIRYRKDNDGKILIFFEKSDDELVCTVEDNGIGRNEAIRLKSINPIEYQSKGMSLIASRIQYMNQNSDHHIILNVEDLVDERQDSMGTRVVLKFPLNTH